MSSTTALVGTDPALPKGVQAGNSSRYIPLHYQRFRLLAVTHAREIKRLWSDLARHRTGLPPRLQRVV